MSRGKLLKTLDGTRFATPPIWMMRQAGRYLPEYRAVRAKSDFLSMCRTPELAVEVTLQPVDLLSVDAAIIFSDILVIPEAMGMHLIMDEGKGPQFPSPLRSAADVRGLRDVDPNTDLRYVMDALTLARRQLNGRVPLIGFAGAPWTLASYMVEGKGTKQFAVAKKLLYEDPATAHLLLGRIAVAVDKVAPPTLAVLGRETATAGATAPEAFHLAIPPTELEGMLPQQAVAWQAASRLLARLEGAGSLPGRTGVFLGAGLDPRASRFHLRHLVGPDLRDHVHPPLDAERTLGALVSLAPSRISREFRLTGPSITISAGALSGIAALQAAVDALERGEAFLLENLPKVRRASTVAPTTATISATSAIHAAGSSVRRRSRRISSVDTPTRTLPTARRLRLDATPSLTRPVTS